MPFWGLFYTAANASTIILLRRLFLPSTSMWNAMRQRRNPMKDSVGVLVRSRRTIGVWRWGGEEVTFSGGFKGDNSPLSIWRIYCHHSRGSPECPYHAQGYKGYRDESLFVSQFWKLTSSLAKNPMCTQVTTANSTHTLIFHLYHQMSRKLHPQWLINQNKNLAWWRRNEERAFLGW